MDCHWCQIHKHKYTNTKCVKVWLCGPRVDYPRCQGSPRPSLPFPRSTFSHILGLEKTSLEPEKIVPVLFDIEGIKRLTVELASVLCHGVDLTKEILPSSSICCKCLPGYTLCYLHCTTVVPALSDIVWQTWLCHTTWQTCYTPHVTPCHKLTCNSRGVPPVSHAQSSPAWGPPAKILCLNIMDIIEFFLPANC